MQSLCASTNKKRKVKRKHQDPHQLARPNTIMSEKTKDFLQKICYKKAASVDMTQYGFMKDRRIYQVNMLMKPLREQLEKICGKPNDSEKKKKRRRPKKPLPATQFLPIKKSKKLKSAAEVKKPPFAASKKCSRKPKCVNFYIVEQPSG